MTSLTDAIALFQHELGHSLSAGPKPSPGLSWEVDRVTLSLQVILDDQGEAARPALRVQSSGDTPGPGVNAHTLTIEFRLRPDDAPQDSVGSPTREASSRIATLAPAPARVDPDTSRRTALAALTDLLGPPGFNSSARASVF